MHRFGVILLIVGAVLTAVGLVAGFGFMFAGEDELAKLLLAAVPIGFLTGFAGVVTTLMFPSGDA